MKNAKKWFAALLCVAMMLSCIGGVAEGMKPGVYEGTAEGRNGALSVAVTVNETAIEAVQVTAHKETVGICEASIDQIPKAIVEYQSLAVDTISGATMTGTAIIEATAAALAEAGADVEAFRTREIVKTAGEAIDKTADVIIVGGGGAGISAAIAAADEGASVILIEKGEMLGGNTLYSGGAWNAVNLELQSKTKTAAGQIETLKTFLDEDESTYPDGYAQTLVELKKEITDYLAGDTTYMFDSVNLHIIQCYQGGLRQDLDGNWCYGNYELVKKLCESSLDTINWTKTWGIEWKDTISFVYGSLWARGNSNTSYLGSGYFEFGLPHALSKGVEVMYSTAGKELIVEDGAVVGVKAEMTDGTPVTLHANKGVVMATGGYGGSVELVKEYNNYWPSLPEEITTNNIPTVTGDGIFMCRDIGANLVGMEFVQLMALSHPVTNGATGMGGTPDLTLYVNKEGKRFVNECAARDVVAAAAFQQTDGMFYSIDDVDSVNKTQAEIEGWLAQGYIWKADTLEDLAAQIGVDAKTLVETVSTYNSYVENGSDLEFHKASMTQTIVDGPFYATPHKPNIHHTMGGVQINADAEVINTEGNVIKGLYAAGEVCGGIHAGNRLGGNAVADALTFGRIAGMNAAK